ncbi:MAG TPA: APC family permease, partial [Verrucomicrobiae bacterium]|nr:APC family permease [Verrucomicrobiae bacterium]
GGPQAMLGWFLALAITIPDGMIWSELGAAMPGSGGSYVYLREAFGRETWGRLMAFLFIWQFMLSGPLEIASGFIGFTQYLQYIWPGLTPFHIKLLIVGVGGLTIFLLYREIKSVALLTLSFWIGTLVTVGAVMLTGLPHFDAKIAFDFPPRAFDFSLGFVFGLGAATRIGVYDYLGYYNICYLGDEVREPGKVIPRSIIFSTLAVAAIYFGINLAIIGVLPWRQFVPAPADGPAAPVASLLMERIHGATVARGFTWLILWTALASVFALMLGYSRIPYAAAQDGGFFKVFGRLHPTRKFPHVSLLLIGLVSIICSFLPLMSVIDALIITRILVQFVGQIAALICLRRSRPGMNRPYRVWLYPLPALLALAGWVFILVTSDPKLILGSLIALATGAGAFLVWAKKNARWPFARPGVSV